MERRKRRVGCLVGVMLMGLLVPLLVGGALLRREAGRSGPAPRPAPRGLPRRPAGSPARGALATARLAIVIDDFGLVPADDRRMLDSHVPFTAAVIPMRPHSREVAEEARAAGHELIVHLPMRPRDGALGEPDAVGPGMDAPQIAARVERALAGVPGAVGVSNHQGSLATEDPAVMDAVLTVVKRHRLFFLDSATSQRSVAAAEARRLGIPFIRRDVFLDNVTADEAVSSQLEEASRIALRRGWAVAIGHVHPVTARVLARDLPALARRGIRVVPLSDLVGVGRAATGGAAPPGP